MKANYLPLLFGGGALRPAATLDIQQWLKGIESDGLTIFDKKDVVVPTPEVRDVNVLTFDGTTSVELDNVSNFGTNDFSIERRIKPTNTGTFQTIAAKYTTGTAQSWWFYIDIAASRLIFKTYANGDGTGLITTTGTTSALTLGAWQKVKVTKVGTVVSLFVDDVDAGTGTANADIFESDRPIHFGAVNNASQFFFEGDMSSGEIVGEDNAVFPDAFDFTYEEDLAITWNGTARTSGFDITTKRLFSSNVYNFPADYATIDAAIDQINIDYDGGAGISDAAISIAPGSYVDKWGAPSTPLVPVDFIGVGATFNITAGSRVADFTGAYSYVEGITFDASDAVTYAVLLPAPISTDRFYFKDCIFKNALTLHGFKADGEGQIYMDGCQAIDNEVDGFHYTSSGSGVGGGFFEKNCIGSHNGDTVEGSNGSTGHYGWRGVRIGGSYQDNFRNLHDVLGAQSLNYSVTVNTSRGAATVDNSFNVGIGFNTGEHQTSDPSTMWLYDCDVEGGAETDAFVGWTQDKLYSSKQIALVSNANGGTYLNLDAHGSNFSLEEGSGTTIYNRIGSFNQGVVTNGAWSTGDGIPSPNHEDGFYVAAQETAPYITALLDGTLAANGLAITNVGGFTHNGSEVSLQQTSATFNDFGGATIWGDGSTQWSKVSYATFLAFVIGTQNSWLRWKDVNGVCVLYEHWQYLTSKSLTEGEYNKNVSYVGGASCGGGIVPFP